MVEKKSPTFWKIIAIVTLSLVVIISAAAIYLNYYWKPILTARIKEAIQTSTGGLYRINFKDIQVNVISGSVTVKEIQFTADTLVYQKMRADSIAPRHVYRLGVEKLQLKRIHPWKIYFDGVLEMSSIVIERPVLQISFNDLKNARDTLKEDPRTAWQRLSPYLNSVKIGQIAFTEADFKYIDHSRPEAKVTGLKDLYIKVSDLLIDSASQYDRSRLYYTRDIYAEKLGYRIITADSNYTVQIQEFKASTAGGYARMKGLRFIPRYGEMAFSQRFNYQKDRYSMNIDEIELNKVNYKLLNRDRRLIASTLILKRANLSIFLNREMRDSLRNRGRNFPQLALRQFQLSTTIDSVKLMDSRVNYSEYNPDSRRKGTVSFSRINGNLTNLTNDSLSLQKNRFSNARLTALLMDRGRFNVNMKFKLDDPKGAFDFRGNVGMMDADRFNTAIRPLSLIEIKSGEIQKMVFTGAGSIDGIKGSMTCFYDDLKIALLERSEKTSWLKRRGIASIFANILIIKSENPSPGESVRSAAFAYKRPQHSSFFNMIWKGFAEALLETIGFDQDTQREIKARLRKMEIERFNREERRDDRLRKRDERRSNREDSRR